MKQLKRLIVEDLVEDEKSVEEYDIKTGMKFHYHTLDGDKKVMVLDTFKDGEGHITIKFAEQDIMVPKTLPIKEFMRTYHKL